MCWLLHGGRSHFHSDLSNGAHVYTVVWTVNRQIYDNIRVPPFFFWDPPEHVHAMCVRSFLLLNLNGLGTRLGKYLLWSLHMVEGILI